MTKNNVQTLKIINESAQRPDSLKNSKTVHHNHQSYCPRNSNMSYAESAVNKTSKAHIIAPYEFPTKLVAFVLKFKIYMPTCKTPPMERIIKIGLI